MIFGGIPGYAVVGYVYDGACYCDDCSRDHGLETLEEAQPIFMINVDEFEVGLYCDDCRAFFNNDYGCWENKGDNDVDS